MVKKSFDELKIDLLSQFTEYLCENKKIDNFTITDFYHFINIEKLQNKYQPIVKNGYIYKYEVLTHLKEKEDQKPKFSRPVVISFLADYINGDDCSTHNKIMNKVLKQVLSKYHQREMIETKYLQIKDRLSILSYELFKFNIEQSFQDFEKLSQNYTLQNIQGVRKDIYVSVNIGKNELLKKDLFNELIEKYKNNSQFSNFLKFLHLEILEHQINVLDQKIISAQDLFLLFTNKIDTNNKNLMLLKILYDNLSQAENIGININLDDYIHISKLHNRIMNLESLVHENFTTIKIDGSITKGLFLVNELKNNPNLDFDQLYEQIKNQPPYKLKFLNNFLSKNEDIHNLKNNRKKEIMKQIIHQYNKSILEIFYIKNNNNFNIKKDSQFFYNFSLIYKNIPNDKLINLDEVVKNLNLKNLEEKKDKKSMIFEFIESMEVKNSVEKEIEIINELMYLKTEIKIEDDLYFQGYGYSEALSIEEINSYNHEYEQKQEQEQEYVYSK